MKARIEFHVDGSIGQVEEEMVEVIVNPSDNLLDSYKRGSTDGLAFLCVKEDKFLFGVMPTYAVTSGYYGLRLINLLDNNGSGFPKYV